jgi:hypothetical protein
MAKNLYHSELVKMGPINVTVKTDVMPSKFKGKNAYVVLSIDGEERQYTTENDECADFFDGQKGATLTIEASGSREEAKIEYLGTPAEEDEAPPEKAKAKGKGPPPRAKGPEKRPEPRNVMGGLPATKEQSAPPAKAPEPRSPAKHPDESPEMRARKLAAKLANCWLIAYAAANHAREQVRAQFNQEVPESLFQGCIGTLLIQMSRDGMHHQLPTGSVDVAPKLQRPKESNNDGGGVA